MQPQLEQLLGPTTASSQGSPFYWTALTFRKFSLLSSQNLPVKITPSGMPHRSTHSRCLGVSLFCYAKALIQRLDGQWGQLPVIWQRPAGLRHVLRSKNPCSSLFNWVLSLLLILPETREAGLRKWGLEGFGELEAVFQRTRVWKWCLEWKLASQAMQADGAFTAGGNGKGWCGGAVLALAGCVTLGNVLNPSEHQLLKI